MTERNPRLRPVETRWVRHDGRPALLLRDRLGLSRQAVVVPQALLPILVLCDGTRDLSTLRSGFELRTGIPLSISSVEHLVDQLDEAMLLESPRFQAAYLAAVEEFRAAAYRPMALAGTVYAADAEVLKRQLDAYGRATSNDMSGHRGGIPSSTARTPGAPRAHGHRVHPAWQTHPPVAPGPRDATEVRGLVSPHIDFARGGPTYAEAWGRAAAAARGADLVVVFGTDHAGSGPRLTLTRQSYATPWGVLATETPAVDAVARALGAEAAFSHELHHRDEHSVETAAVWLHYVRGGRTCPLVPILCGGIDAPEGGGTSADGDAGILQAMEALREATAGRQVLAVAAADLAHVGPAFGDTQSFGPQERASLASEDRDLLAAVCLGDTGGLLAGVLADGDRRKVCGLPPIYALLRFLGPCTGETTGYAQCPADAANTSFVSIAGVLLW